MSTEVLETEEQEIDTEDNELDDQLAIEALEKNSNLPEDNLYDSLLDFQLKLRLFLKEAEELEDIASHSDLKSGKNIARHVRHYIIKNLNSMMCNLRNPGSIESMLHYLEDYNEEEKK